MTLIETSLCVFTRQTATDPSLSSGWLGFPSEGPVNGGWEAEGGLGGEGTLNSS